MIKNVSIKNFKIHNELNIEMKNLTILTGVNGMGKSSVFQLMLLLRQSIVQGNSSDVLNLKGDLIESCISSELICQSSDSRQLQVSIESDDCEKLNFTYIYTTDTYDTTIKGSKNSRVGLCKKISLFNENFQYIGADRFGPKQVYDINTYVVRDCRQISEKKGQCELLAHYMDVFGDDEIPIRELGKKKDEKLKEELTPADYKLREQTQRWLQYISPGIKIRIAPSGQNLKLEYLFDDNSIKTKNFAATQVGYGITYCLPIIVSVLHAKPGSLLFIENPEAHIHPQGQAKLMELISLAAKNGVQVVIESHSDHIINGALVALAKKKLFKKDVVMYYFTRNKDSHTSIVEKLNVMQSGRIKRPPNGFFDQIELDMRKILGF